MGCIHYLRREYLMAQEVFETLMDLATEQRFPFWAAQDMIRIAYPYYGKSIRMLP
jgi:hypothetical protein